MNFVWVVLNQSSPENAWLCFFFFFVICISRRYKYTSNCVQLYRRKCPWLIVARNSNLSRTLKYMVTMNLIYLILLGSSSDSDLKLLPIRTSSSVFKQIPGLILFWTQKFLRLLKICSQLTRREKRVKKGNTKQRAKKKKIAKDAKRAVIRFISHQIYYQTLRR